MPPPVESIEIFDINGPKLDANPIFSVGNGFVSRTANARVRPAGGFANRGGGVYTFQPSDDDVAVGTCYLIDCGVDAFPRWQYGEIYGPNNQFLLAIPFDGNGDPGAGAFTVGSFTDITNSSGRPPPPVVKVGAFEMYTCSPSADDLAIGVALRLDAPPGIIPTSLTAVFQGGGVPAGVAAMGALADLSDVIELLQSGIYTVTRRSPPAFLKGRRLPPFERVFTAVGSAQPASGQVVARLPEGKRNRETMTMFCNVELKTAERAQEPDLVEIDGGTFEVESVKRWAALGNYYEAVVTRRPGS